MGADRAEERVREISPAARAGVERRVREAAGQAAEWCVDVVPLNVAFTAEPDSAPALSVVTAGGYVVHGGVISRRPAGLAARAKAFADVVREAAQAAGAFPPSVRVRDPELARLLAEEMAAWDVAVTAGDMGDLEPALESALEHMLGDRMGARATQHWSWAETDATPAEIEALHRAAAEFYREAVWDELTDPLVLTWPDGREWGASTMGSGGMEYGLVLHSEPDDLASLYGPRAGEDAADFFGGMRGLALTAGFDPAADLTREMRREVAKAGWPVASPDAYVHLYGVNLPERRITPEHVRLATQAFRAVTLYARGEDPAAETGVHVRPLLDDDASVPDLSKLPTPWPALDTLVRTAAMGTGADPAGAVESQWEPEGVRAEEDARLQRFERWANRKHLSKAGRSAAIRNAQCWRDYLRAQRISAGAVTEFDLRIFAYLFYPRGASTTRAAAKALPRSLDLLFEFLEVKEKIAYPSGIQLVAELESVRETWRDGGAELDEALDLLADLLVPYLSYRGLFAEGDVPGDRDWPDEDTQELMILLTRERQRRWLLWCEEIAATGMHLTVEARPQLLERLREWENTAHPKLDGKSPREVAEAYPLRDDEDEDDLQDLDDLDDDDVF